jgi:hypothetical protein
MSTTWNISLLYRGDSTPLRFLDYSIIQLEEFLRNVEMDNVVEMKVVKCA